MAAPIYAGVTKPDYSIPDGKYPARVFQIIQIGSQRFEKNGREWYSPQILLGFELPTLTYENRDGETVSNIKSATYFLSLNPSRSGVVGLREIIDGLRGSSEYTEEELEKFDITAFMGKECMVTLSGVESRGVVYQNITAVEPCDFTKNGLVLEKYREPILVTVDDFKNIDAIDLPDWIKDKIMASQEYREMTATPALPNEQYQPEQPKSLSLDDEEEINIKDVPF